MKVLIVDDEQDTRKSIRLLINWIHYKVEQVIEAADVASAMELIESAKPEIIFSDMNMPGMSGIHLLEWIHFNHPSSKVIVISGYDDFDYVRNSMKHGGLDYLLKPVNKKELTDAFEKAITEWKDEETKRRKMIAQSQRINETKQLYWDKRLSNLLNGLPSVPLPTDELREDLGWPSVRSCQVVYLGTEIMPYQMANKFTQTPNLLYFLMNNVCNEILSKSAQGYAFQYTGPENAIILLFFNEYGFVYETLTSINLALQSILGCQFYFFMGNSRWFPSEVAASFEEAKEGYRQINLLTHSQWIYGPMLSLNVSDSKLFFAEYAERIAMAIRSWDLDRVGAILNQWLEAVRSNGSISFGKLRYWQYEFNSLLQQFEDSEVRQGNVYVYPLDANGMISWVLWKELWMNKLTEIIRRMGNQRNQESSIIYEIREYIIHNFARNLMLQEIADRFFLSREYISRKFKQEFKENISDFIERVRIENATTMLGNPDISISEVSNLVGYQDPRYFSKIFRNLTGSTPGQYRKQQSEYQ